MLAPISVAASEKGSITKGAGYDALPGQRHTFSGALEHGALSARSNRRGFGELLQQNPFVHEHANYVDH